MRLFEISETFNVDEVRSFIEENCQPFLQQINNDPIHYKLYRGNWRLDGISHAIINVRQDRRPMSTDHDINQFIIDAFNDHGLTANRNNSLFCSGDREQASLYGHVYHVFPMGDFTFAWSPKIDDLYRKLKKDTNETKEEIEQLASTYRSDNLIQAITSDHEIMIACKQAIVISTRAKQLEELFQ